MNTSLDDLHEKIDEIYRSQQELNRILIGEPKFKREGLVETVDRHDRVIQRFTGKIAGGALVIFVMWEVVKPIFFNK